MALSESGCFPDARLQEDKIAVPAIVSKGVSDAVHLLHKSNVVFGDLWDPNILYNGFEIV
jgi:hypothetical protein